MAAAAGVVAPMVVATEADLEVAAVATVVALEDDVTRHLDRTQYLGRRVENRRRDRRRTGEMTGQLQVYFC